MLQRRLLLDGLGTMGCNLRFHGILSDFIKLGHKVLLEHGHTVFFELPHLLFFRFLFLLPLHFLDQLLLLLVSL